MPNQPDVLNYLAYSWLDKSGTDKKRALAMLYKAYHQRPDDPYISDSLGWAYYRIGEYRKSLPYVEKAVENAPANAVLNDHLGDIYWQLGRITSYNVCYTKLLRILYSSTSCRPTHRRVRLHDYSKGNGISERVGWSSCSTSRSAEHV